MIQVCSRCGTRWNVRDRQRVWCPRCNGTLLAPSRRDTAVGVERPSDRTRDAPERSGRTERPPRLPAGYRWIAVRPGAAPPPARRRRNLGPTPRYAGHSALGSRRALRHRAARAAGRSRAAARRSPRCAPRWSRRSRCSALAALVHIVRYALLIINRDVLLNPVVACVGDLARRRWSASPRSSWCSPPRWC